MAKKSIVGVFAVALLFLFLILFLVQKTEQPCAPPALDYGPPIRDGVQVNIETRGFASDYNQVGILTRVGSDLILPLMGRRFMPDRWQYYTVSNTGNLNTKLPMSFKGRSCSGEYGCDEMVSGDSVFVEGYNDTLRVTIYEPSKFNYIPHL
jgi:hypothetical protein